MTTANEAKWALRATFLSFAPGSHHPDLWHDMNRMLTLNGSQTRVTNVITLAPQLLERDVPPLLAEVLAAADRAAGYLDGPEYRAARRGDGLQCVANAVVSMRLTTRLLVMSSICMLARAWLTGQRDGAGILKMLDRTAFKHSEQWWHDGIAEGLREHCETAHALMPRVLQVKVRLVQTITEEAAAPGLDQPPECVPKRHEGSKESGAG